MGYIEEVRELVGHRRMIFCGSSVIVRNEKGELLLQQRAEPEGRWCFPGGLMELGESAEETARREVSEETALSLGKLELIGVYSGPEQLCRAPNGDEWYVVNIAFAASDYSGEARINDGESSALRWFAPADIPDRLAVTHRRILEDYLRMRADESGNLQSVH